MLFVKVPLILSQISKRWRKKHKRIALIPTMGNLHAGHMALIEAGRARADKIIVSIFVNPMQFDQRKDLIDYPRSLQEDQKKLIKHGVDILFAPTSTVIYPNEIAEHTFVDVPRFSNILDGKSRQGHFRGVSTVISKLFNMVQPDLACFGEKDFQQLVLIRQLVHDMNYEIEIIGVPTVRDSDGLALSSRNAYLSAEERRVAPHLNQVLMDIVNQLHKGDRRIDDLLSSAAKRLDQKGFKPDILAIRDAQNLQPLRVDSQRAVVLLSAWLGKARLIDNAQVDLIPS